MGGKSAEVPRIKVPALMAPEVAAAEVAAAEEEPDALGWFDELLQPAASVRLETAATAATSHTGFSRLMCDTSFHSGT